jgi:hypothetical protein
MESFKWANFAAGQIMFFFYQFPDSIKLVQSDPAWFQTWLPILTPLLALVGMVVSTVVTFKALNRKDKSDTKARVKEYQSSLHIKRKEHLDKLIAYIFEYTHISEQLRKMEPMVMGFEQFRISNFVAAQNPDNKDPQIPKLSFEVRQEDQFKKFHDRASELIPLMLVESEWYGLIPSEYAGLNDYVLGTYMFGLVQNAAEPALSSSLSKEALEIINGHVHGFIRDLRVLAQYEVEMAKVVKLEDKDIPANMPTLKLGYIPKASEQINIGAMEPKALDMNFFNFHRYPVPQLDQLIQGQSGA